MISNSAMYLEIEEGSLFYEVRGSGEALLLIHGVVVDSWLYEKAAELLAARYKVITFDRRGSSRSECRAGASCSMEAQIGDIQALLDYLNIREAIIVGASAGAVIGQYFMQRFPGRVKKLLMYEPPFVSLMPKSAGAADWVKMMKALIAAGKYNTATLKFMQSIGETDSRAPKKPDDVAMREMNNIQHFLKDEYAVFMDYCPDIEGCRKLSDKITVAVGEKSGKSLYALAAEKFAETTGSRLLHYPGCHNLPADLPVEFAVCVMGTLLL